MSKLTAPLVSNPHPLSINPCINIGYHESSSAGYEAMGREALEAGGNTFAFFTRNPRGGSAKPIIPSDAAALRSIMAENRFAPIVAHAPYTMNPCSAKADLREYALDMLTDDLIRLEVLHGQCPKADSGEGKSSNECAKNDYKPAIYYNLHPGCHTGQGEEEGIKLTAYVISEAIKRASRAGAIRTALLIETMAGKGSEIGSTFESMHAIIDAADALLSSLTANPYSSSPIPYTLAATFDTCHVWDAGYDIAGDLDGVLTKFDKTVGLNRLKAVHLNDSMNDRGSRKDRHQKIGQGSIGLDALLRVIRHPALCRLPFILETPNDIAGYKEEINLLKGCNAL